MYNKYPFCENSINELIQDVERKINKEKPYKSLQENNIIQVNDLTEREKIAHDIFHVLLEYDYMTSENWNQLMKYIYSFIQNFEVPEITIKIPTPKISKNEFYQLFHKLYYNLGERGLQDSFSEFIIEVFIGYEKRKPTNLSKKLSPNRKHVKISKGFPK